MGPDSSADPWSAAHPESGAEQRAERGDQPLRSAVVVNPVRVEDLPVRRRVIESTLAEAGWPAPVWLETTPDDPGAGQARQAVQDGVEVVFVCGGDGTVRSCVEGVAGTEAALAVLPAGTREPSGGQPRAAGRRRRRGPTCHRPRPAPPRRR